MSNKYLEKIAGISLGGVASSVGNFAKAIPGVLRDASGSQFRALSAQQAHATSLADRAASKAHMFDSLAKNTAGSPARTVYGLSARPLTQDIAAHNLARSQKLQAHAASMQPGIDQAQLATLKARNKVGAGVAAIGGAGLAANALSSKGDSQGYY